MGHFAVSLSSFWDKHVKTSLLEFEVKWPTVPIDLEREKDLYLYFVERVADEGYRIEYSQVYDNQGDLFGCSASWFLGGESR